MSIPVPVRATLRSGLTSPILAREIRSEIDILRIQPITHLAREIRREYSKDHLARVNYLTRLPEVTNPKMGPLTVKAELSGSPCIPMQPILDTVCYQHHKGPEDGPRPGQRDPTREGTMPEVLGDRPRPQRRCDIRAKAFEGDQRGIK